MSLMIYLEEDSKIYLRDQFRLAELGSRFRIPADESKQTIAVICIRRRIMDFAQRSALTHCGAAEASLAPEGFVVEREEFCMSRHPGRGRCELGLDVGREFGREGQSARYARGYR